MFNAFSGFLSSSITKVHDSIAPADDTSSFTLADIEGFPELEFLRQRADYKKLFGWYEGEPLNDTVEALNGDRVDRYPVKLNPIKGAVFKHTSALLGEVGESRIPIYSKVKAAKKELREKAKEAEAFLDDVWKWNNGRSVQLRNSLLMQIYGGCIYGVSYIPNKKTNPYGVKIYAVHPSNFIGELESGDEYRLSQAWVVMPISYTDAKRKFGLTLSKDQDHYYIEHWTKETYEITVDGKQIDKVVNGKKMGTWSGENPFGFVPFVYVPRIRTSQFRGETLITENVQGIVLELNRRVADIGDAVSEDAHSITALIDAQGTPQMVEVAGGVNVLMVKSEPNIAGGQNKANMQGVAKNSASQAMSGLTAELYEHFRREANVPAVADGEDEGSQRSSLTLAMRMWPLLSVTKMMRMNKSDALSILNYQILRIAQHAQSLDGLDDAFFSGTSIEQRFHSVLPRDREVFIQELVSRAGSHLGSMDTLLGLLDDIDDVEEEKKAIMKWLKEVAENQASLTQNSEPGAPGNKNKPNPSKNNSANGQKKEPENTRKSDEGNDKGE